MLNQYKIESFVQDGENLKSAEYRYFDSVEEAINMYKYLSSLENQDGTKKFAQVRVSTCVYKLLSANEFLAMYS